MTALTAKEISRTDFDAGVQANVAKAKERLQAVLTPEQYQAYLRLKPREQVLQQESK